MKVSAELIKMCRDGNRRALNELFEKCYGVLLSICLRYEKNHEDARHIMNVGFLKIVTNLDKFPPDHSFENWARRIMINANIDEYRKNRRRKETFSTNEVEHEVLFSRHYETNKAIQEYNAEELENMIRSLPSETQKVFNLFAIDGYSHREISEMLEIPEGTSKWHVSKARNELKAMLMARENYSKARIS